MPTPSAPSSQSGQPAAAFDALPGVDLQLDALYPGGIKKNIADEPISKLIQGVGNRGGFRMSRSPMTKAASLAVLYTTGRQPDWPDALDPQTGTFTYYGDNRKPGHELHETSRGGNLLLRNVFAASHAGPGERRRIPPFLLFEKAGPTGYDVRFRGLLAPGGPSLTSDDELAAIWRTTGGQRFQNYRARFTVLDQAVIPRTWIQHLIKGGDPLEGGCPVVWHTWVETRSYIPLTAPTTTAIRSPEAQLPSDPESWEVLAAIREHFRGREHEFEPCAVELWRLLAPATGQVEVTRRSRDGGRDAVGQYHLGPPADRIAIDFALEAKCKSPDQSVGVKEGSRLISRLRHRNFGVLVTTSYFNQQMQQEIRDDQHPVVLICGRDIVDLLRQHGYTSKAAVEAWLAQRYPAPPSAPSPKHSPAS
ncbi:restriction endonuclease [Kitasatospora sp. NPDC057500]|uniref:restriction endonuclease n=1 Tax=Kitasatospora sp. NPDC057500 TaxID=3346151 RepID=UPI003682A797